MKFLVKINDTFSEDVVATEFVFDTCGGVQFYHMVVSQENRNATFKMLVKAFAAGQWITVIDTNNEKNILAEWKR